MADKRSERGLGQVRRGGGAGGTGGGGDIEQRSGEFGRARDRKGMVKGEKRLEKEQMCRRGNELVTSISMYMPTSHNTQRIRFKPQSPPLLFLRDSPLVICLPTVFRLPRST